MTIDILVEDARWSDLRVEGLARRAHDATLRHLGFAPGDWDISVLACDDGRIAALNAEFRGKAVPTNVLSWPSAERGAAQDGAVPQSPQPGADTELGDIAIAYDTCAQEAQMAGKSLPDHVMHLLVHGILHLLGYDHERDKDATLMEGLEVKILGKLGLGDPY